MSVRDIIQAAAGQGGDKLFVEDVFSTYLYTGNASTQTITNGIDLAGEGGLVWIKNRVADASHGLFTTDFGTTSFLISNNTGGLLSSPADRDVTSYNSDGFSLGPQQAISVNGSGTTYASWTFRKAPKFFDVVTYTGTGSARTVAHNLGSVPGMIIVKATSRTGAWLTYHRSLGATQNLKLNLTDSASTLTEFWNDTEPTDAEFTVGTNINVNESGASYVAYLFAHDAGGFGDTGDENVVSCGSFTTDGSGNATVDLGWEPQYVMYKASSTTSSWFVQDNMRGFTVDQASPFLAPNLGNAEFAGTSPYVSVTNTGFKVNGANLGLNNTTRIYLAIRRPMKTPESGTEVFAPVAYTGTNVDNRLVDTGIITDMAMARMRTGVSEVIGSFRVADRLRGNVYSTTEDPFAEVFDADSFMTPTAGVGNSFSAMNGFGVGNDGTALLNQSSTAQLAYGFKRAPGFFDMVAYTGTGVNTNITHNLGVAPEFMIIKSRNTTNTDWAVYFGDPTKYVTLNGASAQATDPSYWNNTNPTESTFRVGTNLDVNQSGATYIAYLFGSIPGISKIGSYVGNGSTQTINCGFSSGARFVLIRRVNTFGNWFVWDTARGIVSGNDPYLMFNSRLMENSSYDSVDPDPSGFVVNQNAISINSSGDTFIFYAVA